MNFPLPLFLAEDEQFIVRFLRYLVIGEDLLSSGRSRATVGQVSAHVHDLVDRENNIQFEDLKEVIIDHLHRPRGQ